MESGHTGPGHGHSSAPAPLPHGAWTVLLTAHAPGPRLSSMEQTPVQDVAEQELKKLEVRVNELIRTCERLKEENDSLKLGVSSLEVIVHQLRGALGYAVPDHIPANPEILNRIADALNKEIAALQARIRELDQECAYMDALTGAKMEAEAKWAKAEKHIKEKMDEIAALKGVITDMEADARRFPTMAEFSNLQDAYHDLEQEIAGLKAYKEATQNKESAREARIKELEATHGWHCGCDHWNGPNLSVCAQCGRTPLEGRG